MKYTVESACSARSQQGVGIPAQRTPPRLGSRHAGAGFVVVAQCGPAGGRLGLQYWDPSLLEQHGAPKTDAPINGSTFLL